MSRLVRASLAVEATPIPRVRLGTVAQHEKVAQLEQTPFFQRMFEEDRPDVIEMLRFLAHRENLAQRFVLWQGDEARRELIKITFSIFVSHPTRKTFRDFLDLVREEWQVEMEKLRRLSRGITTARIERDTVEYAKRSKLSIWNFEAIRTVLRKHGLLLSTGSEKNVLAIGDIDAAMEIDPSSRYAFIIKHPHFYRGNHVPDGYANGQESVILAENWNWFALGQRDLT